MAEFSLRDVCDGHTHDMWLTLQPLAEDGAAVEGSKDGAAASDKKAKQVDSKGGSQSSKKPLPQAPKTSNTSERYLGAVRVRARLQFSKVQSSPVVPLSSFTHPPVSHTLPFAASQFAEMASHFATEPPAPVQPVEFTVNGIYAEAMRLQANVWPVIEALQATFAVLKWDVPYFSFMWLMVSEGVVLPLPHNLPHTCVCALHP